MSARDQPVKDPVVIGKGDFVAMVDGRAKVQRALAEAQAREAALVRALEAWVVERSVIYRAPENYTPAERLAVDALHPAQPPGAALRAVAMRVAERAMASTKAACESEAWDITLRLNSGANDGDILRAEGAQRVHEWIHSGYGVEPDLDGSDPAAIVAAVLGDG